jgi:hypothetical protein
LLDRELAEQIRGIYKSGSFTDKLQAYTLCYGLQRLSGQGILNLINRWEYPDFGL